MNLDTIILGNHDIAETDTAQMLIDQIPVWFPNNMVTTNVYKTSDNTRVGKAFKYDTLSNGMRVLTFSFTNIYIYSGLLNTTTVSAELNS